MLSHFMLQAKLYQHSNSLTSLFLSGAVKQINKQTKTLLMLICCACDVCFFPPSKNVFSEKNVASKCPFTFLI